MRLAFPLELAGTLRRHSTPLLAGLILVGAQIEIAGGFTPGDKAVAARFALLWTLPLFVRDRFPLGASLASMGVLTIESFVSQPPTEDSSFVLLTVLLCMWTIGSQRDRDVAVAGAFVGYALLVTVISNEPAPLGFSDLLFAALFAFGPVLGGIAVRARADHADELAERARRLELAREQDARAAVADERARIASELHDVIAHAVSVMTVQAGAARLLLREDPERARGSIRAVEETGREALAETRRLLGMLRRDMTEPELEPQPGMASLTRLVEQTRAAGLPVELAIEGTPRTLAPGLDLAAYRIVQEALANTIKYAGPAQSWVTVRYTRERVELEISNNGNTPVNENGSGVHVHGLVGMRERVALYGGELEFGGHPVRGYVVRARLPLEVSP